MSTGLTGIWTKTFEETEISYVQLLIPLFFLLTLLKITLWCKAEWIFTQHSDILKYHLVISLWIFNCCYLKLIFLFIFSFNFVSKHKLWKSKLYIWTYSSVCVCVWERERETERERGRRKERGEREIFFYFTGSLRTVVLERDGEDIYTWEMENITFEEIS